jgi:hypothetical protein
LGARSAALKWYVSPALCMRHHCLQSL